MHEVKAVRSWKNYVVLARMCFCSWVTFLKLLGRKIGFENENRTLVSDVKTSMIYFAGGCHLSAIKFRKVLDAIKDNIEEK
jgi:hypothetical protein